MFFLSEVAYGGIYPSMDMAGRKFTGPRAMKAGSKLHGGPFALTSIRWDMNLFWSKLFLADGDRSKEILVSLMGF